MISTSSSWPCHSLTKSHLSFPILSPNVFLSINHQPYTSGKDAPPATYLPNPLFLLHALQSICHCPRAKIIPLYRRTSLWVSYQTIVTGPPSPMLALSAPLPSTAANIIASKARMGDKETHLSKAKVSNYRFGI